MRSPAAFLGTMLAPLALVLWGTCLDADAALDTGTPGHRAPLRQTLGDALRNPAPTWSVADSLVEAASAALSDGRPWRATQILAPIVDDPRRRTPRAMLLAANAATAWRGWDEVIRLLRSEQWLDSAFDGAGHALLARAALETRLRLDSTALVHARRAVTMAPDPSERSRRLVILARAFDRLGIRDSARIAYERAAGGMPAIGDWLLLRAVTVTSDRGERAALVNRLTTDVARARVSRAEASARERAGDLVGAARLLDSLGDRVGALRLRLARAGNTEARSSIRRELVGLIEERTGQSSARGAAALVDGAFAPLSAREQLTIARNAAAVGPATRAVAGFGAALRAGLGDPADRYRYGIVLARLGRHDDAITQFTRAQASPRFAGRARYQKARSLLRSGRLSESRAELRLILRNHGRDQAAAAPALFLLADLATDEGRDGAARAAFLQLARTYAGSALAPRATFRAAIIAYAHDSVRQAAREFDALAGRYAESDERSAATYWAGRAWARLGDSVVANARWRSVRQRAPRGYYAVLATRRTGASPWTAPTGAPVAALAEVDSAMSRAAVLERVGMVAEAGYEYDRIEGVARASQDRLLATAAAFETRGLGGRTIRLAAEALRRSDHPDAAVYRLLYPLPFDEAIRSESATQGVDPALVMALIRQESSFTPAATSSAGARGLMQIMPAVGRRSALARRFGSIWSDALLYQPDVSVQLGTAHLAALLDRYRDPARALAAYNAGGSRVDRWMRKVGSSDPELFVERIPYVETRDYVRIVLRNVEVYRSLHAL